MSLLRSIERLKRMDDLIKKEMTGPSKEFAEKLGISRSMLMENLHEMKELGAGIEYCYFRRSYHYVNKFSVVNGTDILPGTVAGDGAAAQGIIIQKIQIIASGPIFFSIYACFAKSNYFYGIGLSDFR